MDARQTYEFRRQQAQADDARLDPWSALFGHGRVVLVAVAIAVFVFTPREKLSTAVFGALAALFFVFLVVQGAIDRRRDLAKLRAAWYARSLARLDGKWREFSSTGEKLAEPGHAYARDLDVVGPNSLFQLLDTTRTGQGEQTLGAWLLAPAAVDVLAKRREAVQALVPDVDARERVGLAGLDAESTRVTEEPIAAWAEGVPVLEPPKWLKPLSFLLPIATVATIVLAYQGEITKWVPTVLVVAELGILRLFHARIAVLANIAGHAEHELTRLLPIIVAAARQEGSSAELVRLRESLAGAVEAVGSLRKRVTFFQSRANILLALAGPILLWDLHGAMLLDGWQRLYGAKFRGWLRALGELEALHALATYAFEHPEDSWAELADGPFAFDGAGIGHALLPADACVRNDVRLPGPGTALLVTGSNMSGKSTLLRACGLAAVMALAGLPVRATRLKVSRLQVATCMRVSDSLQEGASFFLAEVLRLKRVVDLATGPIPVFFLLDEILAGTNTRERSLGARGVVAHLVRIGASGLVSTHDLSLVQLGDVLGERLQYAHFTDHVENGRMVFDYRMRPGVVQSSNALRVMHANGLDVELPNDAESPATTR